MVAAALVIVFGAFGYPDARVSEFFIAPVVAMIVYVGAVSFMPAAIAIVVSEILRLRSVFYFLLVGGAIGVSAHEFARFIGIVVVFGGRPIVYPAAGFVAGFVYWLIAGRDAGLPEPDRSRGQ